MTASPASDGSGLCAHALISCANLYNIPRASSLPALVLTFDNMARASSRPLPSHKNTGRLPCESHRERSGEREMAGKDEPKGTCARQPRTPGKTTRLLRKPAGKSLRCEAEVIEMWVGILWDAAGKSMRYDRKAIGMRLGSHWDRNVKRVILRTEACAGAHPDCRALYTPAGRAPHDSGFSPQPSHTCLYMALFRHPINATGRRVRTR